MCVQQCHALVSQNGAEDRRGSATGHAASSSSNVVSAFIGHIAELGVACAGPREIGTRWAFFRSESQPESANSFSSTFALSLLSTSRPFRLSLRAVLLLIRNSSYSAHPLPPFPYLLGKHLVPGLHAFPGERGGRGDASVTWTYTVLCQ